MYLVVLFNLKDGASAADYEAWAKANDMPAVRGLKSIGSFDVFKLNELFRSGGKPPYQYCELIHVADDDLFGTEASTDKMKAIAGQFREFADNPTFIVSEKLDG